MRAKTRRRLILAIVPLLALGGVLAYAGRERSLDAEARSARERGMEHFARGEYGRALEHLGRFIRRLDPDALALLRYGQSIRRITNPDARHVESAIASLRRSVFLEPQNAEARGELLELYSEVGYRTEAIEQADWFLARDPRDERALRTKAITLAEMRQYDRALAVLDGAVRPEDPRLDLHLLALSLLSRLERPHAEIRARAEAVESANAGDSRFRLVAARARLLTDEGAAAKETLASLLPVARGDPAFARLLLHDLDTAGLAPEAVTLLASLAPSDLDASLRAELARRAWEGGQPAVVAEHVARWGPATDALPSPVLGYHVLALQRLGRTEEARASLAALRARADQDAAKGWTILLEGVVLAASPSVAARIDAGVRAVAADAANPMSHLELGLAYRDAGEVELAAREFRTAASLSRGWALPAVLGVRVLAEDGRLPAALQAAVDARVRGSDDPAVAILLALARHARETGGGTFTERVLAGLSGSTIPARETLPIRLALTAASGSVEGARALVREAVASEPAPPGDVLLACAQLSEAMRLGLDEECLRRYEQAHGSTPSLALVLARRVAAAEGTAAGLAAIRARRTAAGGDRAPAWLGVEAAYLEGRREGGDALRAWREAADAAAGDPTLLRTALQAGSVWKDRDFSRAAIDRLKAATGPSCTAWRYHEARWLLAVPKPDEAAVGAAIERLKGVLEVAPEHGRARMLLAGTYELRGEPKKALEQWTVARAAAGSSPSLELRVARLELAVGDWGAARETLDRLRASVLEGPLGSEEHAAMAAMFAQLGDKDAVLSLLRTLPDDPTVLDEVRGRAELYAFAGEYERAERMIGAELSARDDPRALLLAAALADYRGRPADAEALLARLAARKPDALARERMLADHYRRVEDLRRAEAHLRRAAEAEGAEPSDWARLLAAQVTLGRRDAVSATLEAGKARGGFPRAGAVAALSPELLEVAASRPDLRELGAAYVEDADRRGVAERALRLLETADRSDPSATDRARLLSLAQSHPTFLPLQMATVDLLLRRGEHEEALGVCKTASAVFPMSPEPYRAMAYVHRATGASARAADAVREWRSRAAGLPLEPDLFLAAQSPPAEAVALLERHVPRALSRGIPDVLIAWGEAAVRAGERARVETTLRPHLAAQPAARKAFARLAGAIAAGGDARTAVLWLESPELRDLDPVPSDLRVELAAAWQFVAEANPASDARRTSARHLEALSDDAPLAPKDWERVGLVHQANGDVVRAEAAYRRATAAEGGPLVALNNLAMLLAGSGRAAEALPMAKRLVAARPDVAEYRDTLAEVHLRAGDRPNALAQLEEARRLEPANASWAVGITRTLLDGGDREAAMSRFRAFRLEYPEARMAPEVRKAWQDLGSKLGTPATPKGE
jgi:Tfp pilus assembly protein PilF